MYNLISGFKNGFLTGIKCLPADNLVCRNLLSARSQPNVTTELIQKEVNKKFVLGPFTDIPFTTFRINPIGVAEGKYSKKKRLIVDLSAPHQNMEATSLNDMIDKEEFFFTIRDYRSCDKNHKENRPGELIM